MIDNPYNPNPSTVDSLLRQRQTRVDLGREQGLIPAAEPVEQPKPVKFLGVEQTPDYAGKSFGRKVGEDAALLTYSIPVGLAKVVTGLVTHPITTTKELGGGLVQSLKDVANPDYYKAHPLLGIVNLAGFVAPIAGAAKSASLKIAMRAALNTGVKEAVTLGIEETVAREALSIGMKEAGGVLLRKGVFGEAVYQAAKTGKVEVVGEVVKNLLSKSGVADDVALRVATEVSNNLYTTFSQQTTKMKIMENLAHPVSSVSRVVSKVVDPIRAALFGNPAETAVAKLYGADVVAKNPEGFVAIERWADAQLKEQGLAQNVANRQRVMQNWVDQNSQWASLTPEQRVSHFQNYAQSDLTRLAIHEATGIDIVTVKALPQNYVDAMIQTIKAAPTEFDVPKLSTLMEETFGRDFTNHSAEISQALVKNNTREGLIEAVSKLGDKRSAISFTKFSPEVQDLATQLEKTGYRIGYAPTEKPISFAADIFEGAGIKTLPTIKSVADEAYQSTVKNGGVTISTLGEKPTSGFAYAPFKGTERAVSKEQVTAQTYLDYVSEHKKELSVKGNYLGTWESEGKIYFDVSRVGEASVETLKEAMKGKQLAAFDLSTFKEIPLANIKKGVYHQIDEATNIFNKYRGENPPADSTGGISGVPEVPNSTKPGEISTNSVLTKRTAFGNWIDRLGLSPNGIIEGAAEFSYRENFTQGILGDFAKKYGSIVKAKSISSAGQVSIPVEKLFEWLDKNKAVIRGVREKYTLPVRTVFDLKEADLIRAGFTKEIATDIVGISKRALNEIPTSVTGMGDKVINFMRTRNKGYNAWMSRVYDTYLKAAYRGRYDLSPFFSAQEFVETKLNSALFLKDPSLLAGARTVQKLGTWTAEKLGKKLEGTATYLREIIERPPLNEVVAVRDEVLGTLQKTMLDYTSSPDIIGIQNAAMGIKGLASEASFEQSIKSRNLWFGITGQSSVRMATTFNKALAAKFGMGLEEALNFTMENGKKVYKNPQMVQIMRDATQEVFHYKPGFLTSPLIKTMNIVWFPFRFEAKTVALVSKWASGLSPVSRLVVMNNWVHFANWAGTDEGINWRRTNRNMLYNIFSYVTAYEQMGQGIEAIAKGRLFGGNTGLIGGVPLGFVVNLARELAVLPEDEDQFDPKTGRRFTKQIPRELISAATFANAIEQFLISISPSTPFYSLTGGVISGVSPRKIYESLVRQVVGAGKGALEGRDPARGRQMLERDFKRVPLEYNRLTQ